MDSTNDVVDGLQAQLGELRGELEQLKAAEYARAQLREVQHARSQRLARLGRRAALGGGAALVLCVLGAFINTALSAPGAPLGCNGGRSSSLYCFEPNKPAMAADVNNNFEAVAASVDTVSADLAAFKAIPNPPSIRSFGMIEVVIPNVVQDTVISGASGSNAMCFVSSVSSTVAAWGCSVAVSNGVWYAQNYNSNTCIVRCLTWVTNP